VIREGKAFSATLQALEAGCFHDACCYDSTGTVRPMERDADVVVVGPGIVERGRVPGEQSRKN
jgi:hypothetical protein